MPLAGVAMVVGAAAQLLGGTIVSIFATSALLVGATLIFGGFVAMFVAMLAWRRGPG
jgi:hypothetical protein